MSQCYHESNRGELFLKHSVVSVDSNGIKRIRTAGLLLNSFELAGICSCSDTCLKPRRKLLLRAP